MKFWVGDETGLLKGILILKTLLVPIKVAQGCLVLENSRRNSNNAYAPLTPTVL
jgi:hypothetical protein